jgi:Na+-transporting NADH:ubiquinone oxidoreductase subunit NqrF
VRKERKEMIRRSGSQKRMCFIIVSLFCIILYSHSHACAEESLLCADDIEKYCKDMKPGGGRLLSCLKAHEKELSASCCGKIGELQGIITACEEACSGDVARFCKEVQPGGGRILKCLQGHDKELSPSCSAKLEMIGKRFKGKEE